MSETGEERCRGKVCRVPVFLWLVCCTTRAFCRTTWRGFTRHRDVDISDLADGNDSFSR